MFFPWAGEAKHRSKSSSSVCAVPGTVPSFLNSELSQAICSAHFNAAMAQRAPQAPRIRGGNVLRSLVKLAAPRSNGALLTDTCFSPLRAQFGAAKRER
jgi:hypothetical protein